MTDINVNTDGATPVSYSDDTTFQSPVRIRGTNKLFHPNHAMTILDNPSNAGLNALIAQCREIDGSLKAMTLPDISDLTIEDMAPGIVVLKAILGGAVAGEAHQPATSMLFAMEAPLADGEPVPFRRFCAMLGVPYALAKKNPEFLNKALMDYWTQVAMESKTKPVDLVYHNELVTVNVENADREPVSYNAYPLKNLIKSHTTRVSGGSEPIKINELSDRFPIHANVLTGLTNAVSNANVGVEPQLQAYCLGYEGNNKGRHYSRLVFEDTLTGEPLSFHGDDFQLGLNVDSNYMGDGNDGDSVQLSLILFRQICSNGMAVYWSEEQRRELMDIYVHSALQSRENAGESGDLPMLTDEERDQFIAQTQSTFSAIFSKNGMKIDNKMANVPGMLESMITPVIQFFANNKEALVKGLEPLKAEFTHEEENRDEFIDAIHSTAKSLRMKSQELIKYLVTEYVAGEVSGDQRFKTPYDIANFLTFVSRAYDSAVQHDTETKALAFAANMGMLLISKDRSGMEISQFEQIADQLNPKLMSQ